jgi:hypothetical protein
MLRLLGSEKRLCDQISRRDLLEVGGLSALGLTLADVLQLREAHAKVPEQTSLFGKAKACILLFPFGSPPQHETFDPKPDAPVEIQGELKAIGTKVPGVAIGERLPHIAAVADKITLVRSLNHPYPVHGVAYALTGMPTYTPTIEASPRAAEHWPSIGSLVDYFKQPRESGAPSPLPRNIGLPWQFGSKSDLPTLAGPYAAFLGQAYDPVWTDFDGAGTRAVPKLTGGQKKEVRDPFAGVLPSGAFRLSGAGAPSADVPSERMDARRSLLAKFDRARVAIGESEPAQLMNQYRQRAYSLLCSSAMRAGLDVQRESPAVRERYGMTLFGQACLAARRLTEAGATFVSVYWDPFELFGGSCWDTHENHFPRLKEYLLPVFDQTYSALIADLDERGMLDETLVLCFSEHGRTPRIDSKPQGGGRHHWSRVYSAALAGGGIGRGKVVGRSDAQGGDVADTPVSPKDILATALYLLGIDPHTLVQDRLGRPLPIAGDGRFRPELC